VLWLALILILVLLVQAGGAAGPVD